MLETIREYLTDEFECDVFDGSDASDVTVDRVLTFTFRRVLHTVVVTGAVLQKPPREPVAFLSDREPTLADVVMMAEDRPVIVEPTGFRVLDSSQAR